MIRLFCKPRLITLVFAFLLAAASATHADDELFPLPAELQRDVDFWVAVFTDYSSDEGLLHDNRNLAVVYERISIPASVSRRERQRRVGIRRAHYQSILKKLGGGQRSNLTAEEQRVLSLWPADVGSSELSQAASRIRYQQGLSDRFREGLQRAGRWRAHVNESMKRLGVPIELAALPHVESSYNPDARSHVGASGIWQFTRGTGQRFMRADHVLDERNDPYAATVAAAELLAYNYSIVGNWPMAITAYNHGLAGARRAMREFGDTSYVRILREYKGRAFGFASRNFYVAFLAALRIDQDPQKYFPGVTPDAALAYDSAVLPAYLSVKDLVAAAGISERELAKSNPAVQPTVWQGSKFLPKGYHLRVPNGRLQTRLADLLANLDAGVWEQEQLPDLFHVVARGDTLSEIAQAYKTRVSTLVTLNSLGSGNRIRIGQQIRLPAAGPAPITVAAAAPVPAEARAPEPAPAMASTALEADEPVVESAGALPDEADVEDVDDGTVMEAMRTSLLSDPSDYTVADDATIEIHPLETLGHYADWLGIRTQRLRDINGLAFRTPVEIGKRLKLDLGKVGVEAFEVKRVEYHRAQQEAFFRSNTIRGLREHVVKRGESVWVLALRQYNVPLWLFRQYNPELDMHNVRPGTVVKLPVLTSPGE